MTDLPILHQFAAAPFAEKVRLFFGFKRLAWAAVEIPSVMPKPDIVAPTGGYRRTPILQIHRGGLCSLHLSPAFGRRMHRLRA